MDAEFLGEAVRSALGKLLKERLQFSIGGFVGDSGPQSEACEEVHGGIVRDFHRQVYIRIPDSKARRHNGHECVTLVNQLKAAPYRPRVGIEMPPPKPITEHDHRLRVLPIWRIGRNNRTSEHGGDSEMGACISGEL